SASLDPLLPAVAGRCSPDPDVWGHSRLRICHEARTSAQSHRPRAGAREQRVRDNKHHTTFSQHHILTTPHSHNTTFSHHPRAGIATRATSAGLRAQQVKILMTKHFDCTNICRRLQQNSNKNSPHKPTSCHVNFLFFSFF